MKLYLALEEYDSFNHGSYTRVLAVCSSEEKAREALKYSSHYARERDARHPDWINLGEDSVNLRVEIAELDKEYI